MECTIPRKFVVQETFGRRRLPFSCSIRTSLFFIMSSLGWEGISWKDPKSFSQKDGLGLVGCCLSGGFLL